MFGLDALDALFAIWAFLFQIILSLYLTLFVTVLVLILVDQMWKKLPSDHPAVHQTPALEG